MPSRTRSDILLKEVNDMRFYVGTYSVEGSPGIAVCELWGDQLVMVAQDAQLQSPTWLTLSACRRYLYAHGRDESGEQVVCSFLTSQSGLTLLSKSSTHGNSTCHLSLDPDEKLLIASHYHEGRVSLYPVHEGVIGTQKQLVQQYGRGPNQERQEGPHAHQSLMRPGHPEVFTCDLGADRVFIYHLDSRLVLIDDILLPAGSGPRHLAFDGDTRFYVCAELSNEVYCFVRRANAWHMDQVLSTLPHPVDGNTCAAIRLFGDELYVSNRGHDSIARFQRTSDGSLTAQGYISAHGKGPRDFVRVPGGFLIANQLAGGVQYLDPAGMPVASLDIPGAVCVAGTESW